LRWLVELYVDDVQIEGDIKAWRLNDLIAQAENDIAAGRAEPLDTTGCSDDELVGILDQSES